MVLSDVRVGAQIVDTPSPGAPGSYEPGPLTTGYNWLGVTPSTVYTGPATITTAGTVIEDKIIDQYLRIQAANVVIRRCLIVGGVGASNITGLIDCRFTSTSNLIVEDSVFVPQAPSAWINGAIMGHDFTARRCEVYHCTDGFGIYNTTGANANVTIEACWVHDQSYYAPDYATGNRPETHNDCVQVQGGLNINLVGNRFDGYMSTAIGQQGYAQRARGNGVIIQNNVSAYPAGNCYVAYNWFHGGGDAAQLTLRSASIGTVIGNRFDLSGYNFGGGPPPSRYQIRLTSGITVSDLTQNYWNVNDPYGGFVIGSQLGYGRNTGIRTD